VALAKVAFILDEFTVGSAGQQLLDRFLIGYLRDGEFRSAPARQVAVWMVPSGKSSGRLTNPDLQNRQRDHNLVLAPSLAGAVLEADGVVVVSVEARPQLREELLENLLQTVAPGVPCFLHGAFETTACAERIGNLARSRGVPLACGSFMSTVQRLPDLAIETAALAEALILVHGDRPAAEWSAIEGVLPIIFGGVDGADVTKIVRLDGRRVWSGGDDGHWSWSLLEAALSRSNTAQGDSVRDGRTQDLVGKGLVRKLAKSPRAWLLEHRNGLRSAFLVLNGVMKDVNIAIRSREGVIQSAQLYRPIGPGRCEFDPLSAVIEDFFGSKRPPWPIERSAIAAAFMERAAG
jgi:hypothetical protein